MVCAILACVAALGLISRAASSSTARSILILSSMPDVYRLDVTSLSQSRSSRIDSCPYTILGSRQSADGNRRMVNSIEPSGSSRHHSTLLM